MKAKMWIRLEVEVDVEAPTMEQCRRRAVDMIDDLTPEQITDALERAKEKGRMYPHDVTEWVE